MQYKDGVTLLIFTLQARSSKRFLVTRKMYETYNRPIPSKGQTP